MTAAPAAAPTRRVSTTRRTLLRLRSALLVATALALAGCLTVFVGVARTADAAASRSVPAILAIHDAAHALRSAHAAAVRNLADGTPVLGGPGVEYQRQIAGAGQYLTLVAENNAAGEDGTRDIQTVEALLVTYTGLIGQADARYRDASLRALGAATLRDAASLMDDILVLLDTLRQKQSAVLERQVDAGWTKTITPIAWLLPLATLGTLLVLAQVYLYRRFRRLLNLPLVLATAATLAMVVLTSLSLQAATHLDRVGQHIQAVQQTRQQQLDRVRAEAAQRLAAEVRDECPQGCGTLLRTLDADARAAAPLPAQRSENPEADTMAHADRAADSRLVEFVLPVLALGIALLVLAGFQPRLAEYGHRST